MGYSLQIEINLADTDPNKTRGKHWSKIKKTNAKIKKEIHLLTRNHLPKTPLINFQLSVVRYSSAFMDYDNLIASLKHSIDSLKTAGVIKDDNWNFIRNIPIDQVKSKTEKKLVFMIKELDGSQD